jgi:hypothetical protein
MLAMITLAIDVHFGLDAMAQRGLEANMTRVFHRFSPVPPGR